MGTTEPPAHSAPALDHGAIGNGRVLALVEIGRAHV